MEKTAISREEAILKSLEHPLRIDVATSLINQLSDHTVRMNLEFLITHQQEAMNNIFYDRQYVVDEKTAIATANKLLEEGGTYIAMLISIARFIETESIYEDVIHRALILPNLYGSERFTLIEMIRDKGFLLSLLNDPKWKFFHNAIHTQLLNLGWTPSETPDGIKLSTLNKEAISQLGLIQQLSVESFKENIDKIFPLYPDEALMYMRQATSLKGVDPSVFFLDVSFLKRVLDKQYEDELGSHQIGMVYDVTSKKNYPVNKELAEDPNILMESRVDFFNNLPLSLQEQVVWNSDDYGALEFLSLSFVRVKMIADGFINTIARSHPSATVRAYAEELLLKQKEDWIR